MKIFEWAIIIISIILIIFFIFFGRNVVEKNFSYGTWTTVVGQCENDSGNCSDPARTFTTQYCEPDPKTRRGCLDENGIQTYAPIIQETDCLLQCRNSIWEIDVGVCVENPAQNGGTQTVTYTCVPHDTDPGINACTTAGLVAFNDGSYQNVTPYPVGTVLQFNIGCIPPVITTPKLVYDMSYKQQEIGYFESTYRYSPDCQVQGGTYGDLEEGFLVSNDRLNNLNDHSKHEDNYGPQLELIPRNQLDPSSWPQIIPCRRWPIHRELDMRHPPYFILELDKGPVVPIQTPNIGPDLRLFHDWNQDMEQSLYDVPLTWLTAGLPSCTSSQICFDTGAIFLLGIRNWVSKTKCVCNIGVLITDHYWGWLKTGKTLLWTQAQSKYRGHGITSYKAELFTVEFGHKLWPAPGYKTAFGAVDIKILSQRGLRLELDSPGKILGRGTETAIMQGRAILLSDDTDMMTRAKTGGPTCNYLNGR